MVLKKYVMLLALLGGCASIQAPPRSASQDPAIQACEQWFAVLDRQTTQAEVRDGGVQAIPRFPYLRVDRYTASLGPIAAGERNALVQWVERMRALDHDARQVEIANLPVASLEKLGSRESALARAARCGQQLMAADLADPSLGSQLARQVRVEDDYLGWRRALGLYPLLKLPFWLGVKDWHEEATESFRRARSGEAAEHAVMRYLPPEAPTYSRAETAALLRRVSQEPLGIPAFSGAELDRLFATYAPILEMETTGDYDRIGTLYWRSAQELGVDVARPVVYRKLAFARHGPDTLVQLVYVAWFSQRPKAHAFDLLGGQLDGLVWRVTLAPDGEPVLFDTIHPCGCFHMFFPTPRAQVKPAPGRLIEWAFVPAELPALPEGGRIAVQAQTRDHYLRDVWFETQSTGASTYAFDDYDNLRTLVRPDGSLRSAFAPDGLVPGTQRGERFVFWPMGVPSAGAMRQWGRHATAFLGRRHFDDADLIERRFIIRPPG